MWEEEEKLLCQYWSSRCFPFSIFHPHWRVFLFLRGGWIGTFILYSLPFCFKNLCSLLWKMYKRDSIRENWLIHLWLDFSRIFLECSRIFSEISKLLKNILLNILKQFGMIENTPEYWRIFLIILEFWDILNFPRIFCKLLNYSVILNSLSDLSKIFCTLLFYTFLVFLENIRELFSDRFSFLPHFLDFPTRHFHSSNNLKKVFRNQKIFSLKASSLHNPYRLWDSSSTLRQGKTLAAKNFGYDT